MEYTRLGNTGLLISKISFGNMVNFAPEDEEVNTEIIKTCYEAGVNFFDSAEFYENGQAEAQLGRSIKKLNIPREKIIVSVKIQGNNFDGGNKVNRLFTLNRKHVIEGVNASLARMQLDYADIAFAHIYDPDTPIEEICRGFNQVIEDGKAFYWGTSNWKPQQVQDAFNYCDKHGLIRPVVEQCPYNMLTRNILEKDYVDIFEVGYGTTIYSPLQGGLLTGKYNDGLIPQGSRAGTDNGWLTKELSYSLIFKKFLEDPESIVKLKKLGDLAQSIGYTQTQLAIAWTLYNKNVSTAIIGAKNVQQLKDSLKAFELYKKWDKELEQKVEAIIQNKPQQEYNWQTGKPFPDRR
ncbi:unnamed protein product (macronuclear) [Paramecium tetraurelia]|uniref:NADP-dependent oxidoreductase domain-containing protein n=1 Tax=Paramecium tetraurelia TaxID=5888 RepID=A0DXM2_PARTE|nr:uncharacterized protein GSPATT00021413001 [Paramecium tetraurelia]CAK87789.1 unnamed protein product [Paramecium tetraurelia]|eukprot:XP_001455186.1 hypothetical protein (macronuclear) [Paramecium tetraurelia strain d4-2]